MYRNTLGTIVLSLFLIGDLGPAEAEQHVYVLNTSTGAPYATPERNGFQDQIVAEVFRRIGLEGRVAMYDASARALLNANTNVDHGVAMRIAGLEKKFPNLVRVPERLIANDFVAYSRGIDLSTNDWNNLSPYVVAYINGWQIFEKNLVPGQDKTTVKDPSQMFSMLDKKRVDVVLYERWQGLFRAAHTGVQVKVHEPPLASVDMFMYMNKKHEHLVDKMAQALKDMKADGTYQKIFDQTLTSLSKPGGN
ncbi:MAG: transporter substrate-binding domain-containing protein [Rhodospirillaceae bacterium]|jgi:polar amino acid transport system substrate-binding protein|nr:transporter substrate-binding domain-containing protein [Rhodospirillaceae bacterium]MBT4220344.1 transporter substrate-binding domain-containing protein [Rhodospirillaceae bacterium]MBT4463693.1 transporter substrate-binding domain-containing protein [Rhodospirillaceae bacterium]MBT5013870.1 transporter substrate-binding domain-containing protein [Rhodospirillaceae bacterium]MBT7356267.1 transporter substrate-binding domain-containing protein [Rhodospirillaceae bacterium]